MSSARAVSAADAIPLSPAGCASFAHGAAATPAHLDGIGDYSTNEPIMDGTATLRQIFAALVREAAAAKR